MARNIRLNPRPVLDKHQRSANRMAAAEANILTRRIGGRGEFNRRITAEFTVHGVKHAYHVTKSWRRRWTGAGAR